MAEIEQEPEDPMEGCGAAAQMAYVYREAGEVGLRELLEQFINPTPEFIKAIADANNTTQRLIW